MWVEGEKSIMNYWKINEWPVTSDHQYRSIEEASKRNKKRSKILSDKILQLASIEYVKLEVLSMKFHITCGHLNLTVNEYMVYRWKRESETRTETKYRIRKNTIRIRYSWVMRNSSDKEENIRFASNRIVE